MQRITIITSELGKRGESYVHPWQRLYGKQWPTDESPLPFEALTETPLNKWQKLKRGTNRLWHELKQPPPDAKAVEEKKRLDSLCWRKK